MMRDAPPYPSSSCCFGGGGPRKRGEDSVLCCCCTCPTPTSSASALTCLGVCIVVLVYTLLGAFLFMALEGAVSAFGGETETSVAASQPNPSSAESAASVELRSKTVEKLWSITEDLNILYKDNWTRLAAQEVVEFQDALVKTVRGTSGLGYDRRDPDARSDLQRHRWSFSSSFLYSLTLITTIGYGNVTPRTQAGKLATIAYALLGIPLMLVYLSTVGDVLARSFRKLYGKACRSGPEPGPKPLKHSKSTLSKKGMPPNRVPDLSPKGFFDGSKPGDGVVVLDCVDPGIPLGGTFSAGFVDGFPGKRYYHRGCPEQVRVPISLCMIIVAVYVSLGAALFNRTENWTFLEGSYFCFASLSTVGFGDLRPGQYASEISPQAQDVSLCVCSAYILIGMAVIAMCFNLVQDEIIVLVRKFNRACGGRTRHHAPPAQPDGAEEMAMSAVS